MIPEVKSGSQYISMVDITTTNGRVILTAEEADALAGRLTQASIDLRVEQDRQKRARVATAEWYDDAKPKGATA